MSTAEHFPPEIALPGPAPIDDDDLASYFDTVDEGVDPAQYAVTADDLGRPRGPAWVGRWTIDDDSAAQWAASRFALADDEVRRLREQADDWRARIEHWFTQASRREARTARFFEERLEDYALRRRAAGGPATLILPSATIRTTDRRAAVDVEDEEAVAAWADAIPEQVLAARLVTDDSPTLDEGQTVRSILVARRPKVYVGPLRKLTAVETVVVARRWRMVLACGHEQRITVDHVKDVLPDRLTCPECDADPIDGAPTQAVAEIIEEDPVTRDVAVGLDGEPVPGAVVRPGETTAKVTVNR